MKRPAREEAFFAGPANLRAAFPLAHPQSDKMVFMAVTPDEFKVQGKDHGDGANALCHEPDAVKTTNSPVHAGLYGPPLAGFAVSGLRFS